MPAKAPTPTQRRADTASRILDVAERLVQIRGFNGFSYADVADELDITKASLHYHFPGKAELGEALIARYGARFMDALATVDAGDSDAQAKLAAYTSLYAGVLRGGRMCLCGILAAEYETLPDPMRAAVRRFFDQNEAWLARVLADGKAAGQLSFNGSPTDSARTIIGGLEGAMLIARPYGQPSRFQAVADRLLKNVTAG
jgi:TetR/AcrR family transcriptional regulator, transcriptional repressor for nem operon